MGIICDVKKMDGDEKRETKKGGGGGLYIFFNGGEIKNQKIKKKPPK
jgi:hypothetical protein